MITEVAFLELHHRQPTTDNPTMPKISRPGPVRAAPYPPPAVMSLADLATASLWSQSIEAGKAAELVEALRASEAGKEALKAAGCCPKEPRDVIALNFASVDNGVQEGVAGYMPVDKAPWLFTLVKHEQTRLEKEEPSEARHRAEAPIGRGASGLGGATLMWENAEEAAEWAINILRKYVDAAEFRAVVEGLDDVDVPDVDEVEDEDEDGDRDGAVDELEHLRDWLDGMGGSEELTVALEAEFNSIVESPETYLLPRAEVDELMTTHVPLKVVATFTVTEENWPL